MPTLISHLNKTEQRELLNDLNYLNLREMRGFCKQHSIPYTIGIVIDSGERKEPRTPTKISCAGTHSEQDCCVQKLVRDIDVSQQAQNNLYFLTFAPVSIFVSSRS